MDKSLTDCHAKLWRVEKQLPHLEDLFNTFTGDNTNIAARHDKPNRGQIVFRIGKFKPMPIEFSVLVGEVLHNLRSPLDYLVCRLVEREGHRATTDHEFPILDRPSAFERSADIKLANVPTTERKRIERLQPYNGPDPLKHPLRILQSLNNTDKHRLLPLSEGFVFGGRFRTPDLSLVSVVKSGFTGTLKEGAHLLTLATADGIDPRDLDVQALAKSDIVFSQRSARGYMAVLGALHAIRAYMHQYVFIEPLTTGFDWHFEPITSLKPYQEYKPLKADSE